MSFPQPIVPAQHTRKTAANHDEIRPEASRESGECLGMRRGRFDGRGFESNERGRVDDDVSPC